MLVHQPRKRKRKGKRGRRKRRRGKGKRRKRRKSPRRKPRRGKKWKSSHRDCLLMEIVTPDRDLKRQVSVGILSRKRAKRLGILLRLSRNSVLHSLDLHRLRDTPRIDQRSLQPRIDRWPLQPRMVNRRQLPRRHVHHYQTFIPPLLRMRKVCLLIHQRRTVRKIAKVTSFERMLIETCLRFFILIHFDFFVLIDWLNQTVAINRFSKEIFIVPLSINLYIYCYKVYRHTNGLLLKKY